MFQAENVLRLTCYFRHIANDDFSCHPVINTAFSEVLRELQKRRFNLPNEVGVKKRVKRALANNNHEEAFSFFPPPLIHTL
jgi:hypothetical protein